MREVWVLQFDDNRLIGLTGVYSTFEKAVERLQEIVIVFDGHNLQSYNSNDNACIYFSFITLEEKIFASINRKRIDDSGPIRIY